MNASFKIDVDKIKELNGARGEAFFSYLDRASKNNTPIILQGTKKADYWECSITECSTPTSIFTKVLLPAAKDTNSENTKLVVQLTTEILRQFDDGTEFTFGDTTVKIRRGNLKLEDSRKDSLESSEEQLREFQASLEDAEKNSVVISLKIDQNSTLIGFLKELRSSVDASIFIDNESITLRKDSIFFRTKNQSGALDNKENKQLYINMYLANLIMSYLKVCDKVVLDIKSCYTVVTGYLNDELIMKNVSAAFEATDENPSDEDLSSIIPLESESQILEVDIKDFITNLEKQKSSISAFTGMKNWITRIYKNGNGVSFGFLKDGATTALATVHVGEISKEDLIVEDFPSFSTVLPIDLLKNLFANSLSLKIVYQDAEETAVLFQVGDSKILSGKIY